MQRPRPNKITVVVLKDVTGNDDARGFTLQTVFSFYLLHTNMLLP